MDLDQEIKSFTPIDIEKFSQDSNVPESVIDSIKAYNKAIEYLRTGSEDIAIIELKRVVAVNPDFYEAVNLLGLCYAYTNQLDKAQELFGKVVQSEDNVLKAAEYLNYVTGGDSSSSRKKSRPVKGSSASHKTSIKDKYQKKEVYPVRNEAYNQDDVEPELILIKTLGNQFKKPGFALAFNLFSVICLVAALVFFILAVKDTKDTPMDVEPVADTTVNETLSKTLQENKELKMQLDEANLELKQYKLSNEISQVSTLYSQGKYLTAAEKLREIPVDQLNAEQKERYETLKKNVNLKAASELTTKGNSLYNSKKYAEAIENLEKVFELGDNWTFGDKALYILGKSYVEQGENQKGAETFQKLITQYPKSQYVKYAKSRLKALQ